MKRDLQPPLKILFVVHEMYASGAPAVLLDFMHWLKNENKNVVFDILTLNAQGVLYDDFTKLSRKVLELPKGSLRTRKRILNALIGQKTTPMQLFGESLQAENYTHIYINSMFSLNVLHHVNAYVKNVKKIIHVHESEFLNELYFTNTKQENLLSLIDGFIAVSEHVKSNLIEKYQIKKDIIEVVYPFVKEEVSIEDLSILKELNIKETDFIIATIGNPHNVKGTDIVPLLVKKIKKNYPDFKFKFLIIGGHNSNEAIISAKIDARKLNIEDNLIFVNHVNNVNQYFPLLDAYVLTSREESFSLMVAKAVYNEVPVIMFANNGGPCEIISASNAHVVEYLDLDQMAEIIYSVKENYDEAKKKCKDAKLKIENVFSTLNTFERIHNFVINI